MGEFGDAMVREEEYRHFNEIAKKEERKGLLARIWNIRVKMNGSRLIGSIAFMERLNPGMIYPGFQVCNLGNFNTIKRDLILVFIEVRL